MCRHDLTDRQYERLEPLLPPERPPQGSQGGRAFVSHRRTLNGLLWLDRTGAPWRAIPEHYGPWSTLASRCYRWREQGLGQGILDALQQQADDAGLLDWEIHDVDGTGIRAHQHAAGAPRSQPQDEALGRSQGGVSTKVHVRAEGQGKLLTLVLTPGQRHEATAFEQLMEQGAVKRVGRGRPRLRPRRVVGDTGYSSRKIRQYLRRHGVRMTIPHTTNERRGRFDRAVYRLRNLVERLINRLKQFRRVATRYEKRGVNYHGMLLLAAIKLWL